MTSVVRSVRFRHTYTLLHRLEANMHLECASQHLSVFEQGKQSQSSIANSIRQKSFAGSPR